MKICFFRQWFILCKMVNSPNNRDLSSDNPHQVPDFLCMILRSESGGQLVHAKSYGINGIRDMYVYFTEGNAIAHRKILSNSTM